MIDLKDKFTLVITVHERKHLISDCVQYYIQHGETPYFNIIIADSSEEVCSVKVDGKPVPVVESVDNSKQIQIVHTPGMLWYEKMKTIHSSVKTPYVLELADDDRVYIEAIFTCIRSMESFDNIICSDGMWDNTIPTYHTGYTIKGRAYKLNFPDSLESEYIKNRVNGLCHGWTCPNHSIFKTEFLRDAYAWIMDHPDLWPVKWWDKILMIMIAASGERCTHNIHYGASGLGSKAKRLLHDPEISYPKLLQKDTRFGDIFKDEKYIDQICDYVRSTDFPRGGIKPFITELLYEMG